MTDLDTEHIGNAILVRTEQRFTGHQHVRRYTTLGRHPYWACSANGWRACQGHDSVATIGQPCGHPLTERRKESDGKTRCGACRRERERRAKAA